MKKNATEDTRQTLPQVAVTIGGVRIVDLDDGRLEVTGPLAGTIVTTRTEFLAHLSEAHRQEAVAEFADGEEGVASVDTPGGSQQVHQPWCDHAEHAQVAEEMPERAGLCVGRLHEVTADGLNLGGWWTQNDADTVLFHLDQPTKEQPTGFDLTPAALMSARSLLDTLSGTEGAGVVLAELDVILAELTGQLQ